MPPNGFCDFAQNDMGTPPEGENETTPIGKKPGSFPAGRTKGKRRVREADIRCHLYSKRPVFYERSEPPSPPSLVEGGREDGLLFSECFRGQLVSGEFVV
jgi:hypothetical protein